MEPKRLKAEGWISKGMPSIRNKTWRIVVVNPVSAASGTSDGEGARLDDERGNRRKKYLNQTERETDSFSFPVPVCS